MLDVWDLQTKSTSWTIKMPSDQFIVVHLLLHMCTREIQHETPYSFQRGWISSSKFPSLRSNMEFSWYRGSPESSIFMGCSSKYFGTPYILHYFMMSCHPKSRPSARPGSCGKLSSTVASSNISKGGGSGATSETARNHGKITAGSREEREFRLVEIRGTNDQQRDW